MRHTDYQMNWAGKWVTEHKLRQHCEEQFKGAVLGFPGAFFNFRNGDYRTVAVYDCLVSGGLRDEGELIGAFSTCEEAVQMFKKSFADYVESKTGQPEKSWLYWRRLPQIELDADGGWHVYSRLYIGPLGPEYAIEEEVEVAA